MLFLKEKYIVYILPIKICNIKKNIKLYILPIKIYNIKKCIVYILPIKIKKKKKKGRPLEIGIMVLKNVTLKNVNYQTIILILGPSKTLGHGRLPLLRAGPKKWIWRLPLHQLVDKYSETSHD